MKEDIELSERDIDLSYSRLTCNTSDTVVE